MISLFLIKASTIHILIKTYSYKNKSLKVCSISVNGIHKRRRGCPNATTLHLPKNQIYIQPFPIFDLEIKPFFIRKPKKRISSVQTFSMNFKKKRIHLNSERPNRDEWNARGSFKNQIWKAFHV